MYEPSTTATRVNIVFSEGNTHATLTKLIDIATLLVFSLFSKLPRQTVPVLQKSQGLCWPGGTLLSKEGAGRAVVGKLEPQSITAAQATRLTGSHSHRSKTS